MSDEQLEMDLSEEPIEGEIVEEVVEEVVEEQEEPTEEEVQATAKGWNPEGVEGKRTLTAEEFNDRQPLYDELHKQKRANKKLADKQTALFAHLEQIRKGQVDEKIDRLKKDKRNALEEQDHDRVRENDKQIVKTHGEPEIEYKEKDDTMFETWIEDNTWYGSDQRMRRYADALGKEMVERNNGRLTTEDLEEISKDVKETFNTKFASPKRTGSPVEGSRPRSKARVAKYTVKDLDPDARKIHDDLVRDNVMTSEEYIKDLEMTDYFS